MWQTRVFPGDLIVNRIPEQDQNLNLGYKLALGKVVKSGIADVKEGALVVFELTGAKEFSVPQGLELDWEPSPLGVFRLREGDLGFEIRPITQSKK
jgi:hypothetical protein